MKYPLCWCTDTLDYRKSKGNTLSFDNRDIISFPMTYYPRMRLEWIDEQLEKRGRTRRWLADSIPGLSESKLSLVMKGERKLSSVEADNIRRLFGYRLPDDPIVTREDRIRSELLSLGDGQIRAVALYLEALSGNSESRQQAS